MSNGQILDSNVSSELNVKQPTIGGPIGSWSGGGGGGGMKRPPHHFRVPLTSGKASIPSALHSGRQLRGSQISDGEVTSTTTGLDMDSLLDDADLSTDVSSQTSHAAEDESASEMNNIRRQLECLETMYSEVTSCIQVGTVVIVLLPSFVGPSLTDVVLQVLRR